MAQPYVQEFPAEFFSGVDVSIYCNGVWLEDISSISFRLFEQKRPLYGYKSYTYDKLLTGNRLIQGQFRIPFRSLGYLHHMAERVPSEERISDLLQQLTNHTSEEQEQKNLAQRVQAEFEKVLCRFGDTGPLVAEVQEVLIEELRGQFRSGGDPMSINEWDFPKQTVTSFRLPQGLPSDFQQDDIRALLMDKDNVVSLQQRLRLFVRGIILSGEYDQPTQEAVKYLQQLLGHPVTGQYTTRLHEQLKKPLRVTGVYDLPMFAAVGTLNVLYGYDFYDFSGAVFFTDLFRDLTGRNPQTIVIRQPETEVLQQQYWGSDDEPERRADHQKPFFPAAITLHFNYGAYEHGVTVQRQPMIRTLRGVELSSNTHWVGDDFGRPVDEVYEFIAHDMDQEPFQAAK